MGHLYGVALMDAVVEIREAAFRMRADGATQGGAGGQPPPNCLVLVAPDADAICASIIIERVLTGEKVLHDIAPVAGYTEVVRKCRAFGPNLRSVVLVNCGASANLGDLLWPARPADPDYLADWWSLPEEAHVYVLDVHRPFNHHNVRNREQRVTVLDYFALPGEGDDVPRAGDSDAEDELDEEEEEEGESEAEEAEPGEEEEEAAESAAESGHGRASSDEREGDEGSRGAGSSPARGQPTQKRRRLRRAGGDASEGDDSEGGGEGEGGSDEEARASGAPASSPGVASRRSAASSADRRRRRRAGVGGTAGAASPPRQQRLDQELRDRRRAAAERYRRYYSGNHYGTCAALVAYELAEQVGGRAGGQGGPRRRGTRARRAARCSPDSPPPLCPSSRVGGVSMHAVVLRAQRPAVAGGGGPHGALPDGPH